NGRRLADTYDTTSPIAIAAWHRGMDVRVSDPTRNLALGAFARASATMSRERSMPTTSYPASTRRRARMPLPDPISTMRPDVMWWAPRRRINSGAARFAKSPNPASWTYARAAEYMENREKYNRPIEHRQAQGARHDPLFGHFSRVHRRDLRRTAARAWRRDRKARHRALRDVVQRRRAAAFR